MANFIAHIANCLIHGDKFERDGSSILDLVLNGNQISIIQRPEISTYITARDSFHGKLINTTKIIVFNVEENNLENIRLMIYSLCHLLSFLTCSQVRFHSQEYPRHSSSSAIVGKTNIYHPVIDIKDGNIIRDFIQSVWGKFITIEKIRNLDMIFDYIHNANYPDPTIESKLVFSFVTLESLKHSFATVKGYPFIKNYFRKTNNEAFNFTELLEQMFNEVGMVFSNKKMVKDLRNEIIHSGVSQFDFNYNFKIFVETQNLIREYLIKLLGYSKNFNKI